MCRVQWTVFGPSTCMDISVIRHRILVLPSSREEGDRQEPVAWRASRVARGILGGMQMDT